MALATPRRGYNPPPAAYYDNSDKRCRQCKRELTGRKTRFCCLDCSERFWMLRHWVNFRLDIFKEDDWTCRRCGFKAGRYGDRLLHADHIVPLADGGPEFLRSNIRTLCIPCHKVITKAWHKRRSS
jgi:5-methylcytosine-specific restriction endonuclease McrA